MSIGLLLTGLGWNWDKIKEKNHGADAPNSVQSSTSGDHSSATSIEQHNIILSSGITPQSSSMPKRKIIDKPIKDFNSRKDFSSGYTLAADMNIKNDHVYVEGINVRGNVNVDDSKGAELKDMYILKSGEDKFKGKVNIDRSQEFNIKENVVQNEINVDRSRVFNIERNSVGEIANHDLHAQDNINIILLKTSRPEAVMSSLITIQKLISEDSILANALGNRIKNLDEKNDGKYKSIVVSHLKKLNIDTLEKAQAKNVGMVFHWLDFFIHFNKS
jgi:hypothetical protein